MAGQDVSGGTRVAWTRVAGREWPGREWPGREWRDASGRDASGGTRVALDASGGTRVAGTRVAEREWPGREWRDASGRDVSGGTRVAGTRVAGREWPGREWRDASGRDASGGTRVAWTRVAGREWPGREWRDASGLDASGGTRVAWTRVAGREWPGRDGSAILLEGTDRSEISTCRRPDDEQCIEATCTAWDQPGNTYKFWACVGSQEANYKQTMEIRTKSNNVSCALVYGEKGKNLTNVPSSAAENRLRCKAGTVNASEAGRTYYNDCLDGYDYCYAAFCAKAKWNEHVRTMWGCSKDTGNCDALSVAVSAQIDSAVKCECTFGEKGMPKGNKKLPLSTTASQKPTTLTTTTTTTKTTMTVTEKPTTTTEKPTTLQGQMSITGQPMTTSAETNRCARRRFAVFWILLVAIGTLV
uniref:Ig-like domain-containing protein n=1 Tax=Globodera pallida TaxID=36090 RepID=A0A183CKH7_GLOPA